MAEQRDLIVAVVEPVELEAPVEHHLEAHARSDFLRPSYLGGRSETLPCFRPLAKGDTTHLKALLSLLAHPKSNG